MDLDKLRAKMKAKTGPAPLAAPEPDEDDAAPAGDDEMKQKIIDAVTAAVESCFAAK